MSAMLPKLFFLHFCDTSFVVELAGEIIGFLVGFLSQSNPQEAYTHFIGIHPNFRKQGVGRILYNQFFGAAQAFDLTTKPDRTSTKPEVHPSYPRPNRLVDRQAYCRI